MKQRDARTFLWDVDDACGVIEKLVAGKTIEDYGRDTPSRFAIERAFEIIGEAVRNALDQKPDLADRITNAAEIISFRNRIAHEYWGILSPVVWAIIQEDLPVLRREVAAILRNLPPPEDGDIPG